MTRRSLQGTGSWQPPSRPRRFRSLASRLVALGVVQLFLLALTAIIVFIAEGPHDEANPEDKITAETVAGLERLVDYPAALNDALDALRTERVEISLYDEAHQLIASNVDPPLAIPQRPPRRFRRPPGDDHWPPPDNHGPPPDDDHRPPPSDDHQPWPSPNDDRRSPDDDRRPPPDDHHRPPSDDEHRPPLDDDHREPADRPSADQPAAHAEGRPSADRPTDRAEDRPSADRPASRADDRPPGPPESWGPPGAEGSLDGTD